MSTVCLTISVTHLAHMCAVPHSYVWEDSCVGRLTETSRTAHDYLQALPHIEIYKHYYTLISTSIRTP